METTDKKTYYLLEDLEPAIEELFNGKELSLKVKEQVKQIEKQMLELLQKYVEGSPIFSTISYEEGKQYFAENKGEQDFVIDLGGKTYIKEPEANLDGTRTYKDLDNIVENRRVYKVEPRGEKTTFKEQITNIVSKINGSCKRVVVTDDGVVTGNTLKKALQELSDYGISIDLIRVLGDYRGQKTMEGIPVESYILGSKDAFYTLLNMRDLFFVPKGGASVKTQEGESLRYPYIYNSKLAESNAFIKKEKSEAFCKAALDINITLFSLLAQNDLFPKVADLPQFYYLNNDEENKEIKEALIELKKSICTNSSCNYI